MTAVPNPNWTDQTIWTGDNLDIKRGLNSATVDLIYIDPPFNSNADYVAAQEYLLASLLDKGNVKQKTEI